MGFFVPFRLNSGVSNLAFFAALSARASRLAEQASAASSENSLLLLCNAFRTSAAMVVRSSSVILSTSPSSTCDEDVDASSISL